MVTHVPPPSPSLSSTSLSTITGSIPPYNRRSSSSRAPSQAPSSGSSRHAPSSYRPPAHAQPPTNFPPSPPLSHSYASSPPSSYVAPRLSEKYQRSQQTPSRSAPSATGSRATEAARHHRHRASEQRQADSRHHKRRTESRTHSPTISAVEEEYDDKRNAFPWFGDSGDVEIELNDRVGRVERRYKLHNLILRQNSKWWNESLGSPAPITGTGDGSGKSEAQESIHPDYRGTKARSTFSARSSRRRSERKDSAHEAPSLGQLKPQWCFQLDWSDMAANDGFPMLIPKPTSSWGNSTTHSGQDKSRVHPPTSNHSFFRSLTGRRTSKHSRPSSSSSTTSHPNPSSTTVVPPGAGISEEDTDSLTAYASLFSILYNHAPTLDDPSLPDAYVQSKTLLRLADLYDALPIVRPRVEHHLLHFNRTLYRNIARYPPSYLKLGHLLQSRKIFGEALIHVVGQWPVHEKYLTDLDHRVRDLIEDKHDELLDARNKVDARLFRINLSTSRGDRVGPGHFLDWMAVSLFRDWLAAQTPLPPRGGILKNVPSNSDRRSGRTPAGGKGKPESAVPGLPYRLMSEGGEAYLPRSQLKDFLKHQAPREMYDRDSLKRLERRVDEVKAQARDQTRGLCRSFLEGDNDGSHLACTRVEERDWGWVWPD